ncbi:MAG TPA: glycerophosphodiester phosphodiesterase family protein [Microbacteriaceae bacterium]|nr:glycerophosphodiester phosphodiesterase family protein [Microbacteriaceae bacterium]
MTRYFDPPRPRVLAHRGLAIDAPENTPLAFVRAIEAGALHIETDVHASSDGVAVVAHDADLSRVAGREDRLGALSARELAAIDLGHGQGVVPLADVLDGFPETRFNIDVKDPRAVEPTARAVLRTGALDRVLITSFSGARRSATIALLPGVATSASAGSFLAALIAGKVGLSPAVRRGLRGVDAVQIPEHALGMSTVTARAIRGFHAAGVEVHVWTINDPRRMRELFELGVDGVVTDRADLAVRTANGDTL